MMNLPSSMWSSMAISAATRAGWVLGMLTVPVPSVICLTCPTKLDKNMVHEVMFSARSVECSPV